MKNAIAKVNNPTLLRIAANKLAEKLPRHSSITTNLEHNDEWLINEGYKYVGIYNDNIIICKKDSPEYRVAGLVSLSELFNRLYPIEELIKIDGYTVEFKESDILKIGCILLEEAKIKSVVDRLGEDEPEINFEESYIKIQNREHSEAVQKKLFELGVKWRGSSRQRVANIDRPYLIIRPGGLHYVVSHSEDLNEERKTFKKLTLDDLYAQNKDIVINNSVVKFKKTYIVVSGIRISNDKVRQIYSKMKNHKL